MYKFNAGVKTAFTTIAMEKKKGFVNIGLREAYDTYAEVGENDFCSNGERKR